MSTNIKLLQEYLSDYYDIKYWIDDETAYVHYWDDEHGDFYLEEKINDLLDNIGFYEEY